jgi:hypothetical protein
MIGIGPVKSVKEENYSKEKIFKRKNIHDSEFVFFHTVRVRRVQTGSKFRICVASRDVFWEMN